MKNSVFCLIICYSLCSCIDRTDIKNEIAAYHACVTKCEDIENTVTFNFYKCNQTCLDTYEAKLKICNSMEPNVRDKGRVDLEETRNVCIEGCQQKAVSVKLELKEEIRKCKDICIYHLKK